MAARTRLTEEIPEGSTPVMTFQVVDRAGVGFRPDVFVLTLYDARTSAIINGRDAQNVLNANNVTIDTDGNVEFQMVEADTPILGEITALESHIALFEWEWNTGLFKGKHEIQHAIRNLSQVT